MSDLQQLIDDTPDGGVVDIPPKEYLIYGPLSLRGRTALTIEGPGIPWFASDREKFGLIIRTAFRQSGWPIIDMTGANKITLGGMTMMYAGASRPFCGILAARETAASAGCHHFHDLNVAGEYTRSAFIDIGSEDWVAERCHFSSWANGTSAYLTSGYIPKGLEVDVFGNWYDRAGIDGAVSNVCKTFRNCYFRAPQGGKDYSDCVLIEEQTGTHNTAYDRCVFRMRDPGKALFELGIPLLPRRTNAGVLNEVGERTIRDPYTEAWGAGEAFIEYGKVGKTTLDGGRFSAQ